MELCATLSNRKENVQWLNDKITRPQDKANLSDAFSHQTLPLIQTELGNSSTQRCREVSRERVALKRLYHRLTRPFNLF